MVGKMNGECLVCQGSINNPECERCYTEEIQAWLRDFSEVYPENIDEIFDDTYIDNDIFNEGKCIFCKTHFVNMCSFCFFHEAFEKLNLIGLREEIIEDFEKMFPLTEDDELEDKLLVTI